MISKYRYAKVNVKVLIILILVTAAIGISLFTARQVRRSLLSKMNLEAGQAAYENQDWPTASIKLRGYLSRNPDDIEILRKYAKASLSIRPINADSLSRAVSAYRRILQLNPADDIAYEKLAMLYAGIGNFEELAYISETRLSNVSDDRKAVIWRADALIRLHKTDEAKEILQSFLDNLDTLDEKYPEYAQACAIMSTIILSDNPVDAGTDALKMLNKAVEYNPKSAEAFLNRARFYREMSGNSGTGLQLARQDLEAVDALDTDNPRVYLSLGMEWIAHSKMERDTEAKSKYLERAEAQLKLMESLSRETLEEYFFDLDDWTVSKYLLASEIAAQQRDTAEGVSLSDKILAVLTEKGHRIRVLPNAISFYVAAGKVAEARRCLDEYINITQTMEMTTASKQGLAFLQAQVARAEGRMRAVIDDLQPAVASNQSPPEIWRSLAEAYSLTNQPRRAINALIQYLRFDSQNAEMTMQLAKEYLKLRDFDKAFQVAQRAESLDPTVLMIRLLRIEASIYIAAGQTPTVDSKKLEALSVELAELQKANPQRVDIRLLKAMIAEHLQKPEEAEAELKLAIEECAEPLMAEMQLVRHYSRLKRMDDAIKVCRAVCERHPEVAVPWLSLSSLYVANEDYETARNYLQQGLKSATDQQNKRSLSISLAMLEFNDQNGDPNTGINLLKEIALQDEHEIGARLLLLDRPEIRKDPTTAQKLVDELKNAEGQSGLYWRVHQASLWLSGDDWRSKQRDITDTLQYCIDSDDQWSQPVLLLARMYNKLGESERVEEICRQALDRNPSATDVAGILLSLLQKQERFTEVEQILRQIEASPRVMSDWNVQSALRAGEFSQAIEELKLRMPDDDQDANSRILLARLLYRQNKDAEKAFEYLKEAEAIKPGLSAIIATKAFILRSEGRAQEARQILDDYVRDNNSFIAYSMRAAYLVEEGDLEKAEEDYKKLNTFVGREAAGYELLSNFYSKNQNFDKAIVTLEEGVNAYPKDPRLQRRLMSTLFLQGQEESRQRALEILAALEEKFPQDPELMKLRAIQILNEPPLTPESIKAAREKLEDATELVPTDVDAHLALIDIAMRSRNYEAARDYAIRALDDNSNNMALRLARSKTELAIGNVQIATQIANLVLQNDPNNPEALGVLLNAAVLTGGEDRGLIDDAIKSARLMLAKDPNNTEVREVIVAAALSSNNQKLLEEARSLIEADLAKEPANEMLLLSRTRILISMNQAQAAIPELESYIRTQEGSRNISAIITLADLHRINGDLNLAQKRIEQAGLIDPDNQSVIHARLLLMIAQKRFDEIPEVCSAYLTIEEPNPATMTTAASILASMNSLALKKEGLKFYERVISLSPSLLSARLGLASTLYQTGDIQGAKQAYQKVLDQYPDNIRALNDLAWILQENDENYADALELAKRGLAVASDKKDILHLLDTEGTILSNMPDRLESARRDFTRLVDMSPDDTYQKAKALLKLGRVCIQLDDLENAKQHMKYALEIDKKINVLTPDERTEITKVIQEG